MLGSKIINGTISGHAVVHSWQLWCGVLSTLHHYYRTS